MLGSVIEQVFLTSRYSQVLQRIHDTRMYLSAFSQTGHVVAVSMLFLWPIC